jgi:hypothetical protein
MFIGVISSFLLALIVGVVIIATVPRGPPLAS